MNKDKAKVRQVLDALRASGRDALTAPEGKQVCDAYGIAVPGEGLATSAAQATRKTDHALDDVTVCNSLPRLRVVYDVPRPDHRPGVRRLLYESFRALIRCARRRTA